MALADTSGERSIPNLAPTKVHLFSPGPSAALRTHTPRSPTPHHHQPLLVKHWFGPAYACGITCHVPGLLYIPLEYHSQVLTHHSDPPPCHSVSLSDTPSHQPLLLSIDLVQHTHAVTPIMYLAWRIYPSTIVVRC